MTQASPYSLLFEPVKIGPVTARNRFYQVPHCNGMGHVRPRAEAANRAMKAAGGWAVVSTQEAEIHPTSDLLTLCGKPHLGRPRRPRAAADHGRGARQGIAGRDRACP
ncbi:hypothetical protein ACM25N_09765 [Roseovarius sp. C7]|uniref:oxidoreductase n=1 Tax=Roseovarius sp. C7 TaxID=3398643 RepID=UPI0039F7243B